MESMFSFTAKYLAVKHGYPDTEARKYNIRAFRSINEAIADPSRRFNNSTIVAIMGRLHDLYQMRGKNLVAEEKQEIDAHIEGIRYLIKGKGGFCMACNDPSIS